jgi:hypothetical protein
MTAGVSFTAQLEGGTRFMSGVICPNHSLPMLIFAQDKGAIASQSSPLEISQNTERRNVSGAKSNFYKYIYHYRPTDT